jgi:RNA polymerase sigma factor (sigma-70 family)
MEEWEGLAREAKAGDRDARDRLYFAYERRLRHRSRRARRVAEGLMGGSGPICGEDVDQELFIIFYELLDGWNPDEMPFEEHLGRHAGWNALRYVRRSFGYRRKARVVRFAEGEAENMVDPVSERDGGELTQAEESLLWRWQTDDLDERWRRMIELRFGQDLSSGEIAIIDGHTRRKVNRNLRSAIDAVRTRIEDGWESCG